MYTPRQLISNPGLSQEEALLSIQEHPEFTRRSAKVSAIRRRGDRWVVTVLEKTAGPFPPEGGEESGPPKADGPAEEGPDDSDGDDEGGESGPPPFGDEGGEDGPPKEKGKGGELHEVLHLLQGIADALGVVPPDAAGAMGPDGPDGMGPGPDGPPAPPPHGGPAMGPGGPGGLPGGGQPHGTKLKPGEVPNRPGVVPVGSPSFASTKTARLHDPRSQVKIAQAIANFKSDYPTAAIKQAKREGEYIRILFTS